MGDSQQQNEIKSDLSFEERLVKLLEHWIKHNQDHSDTYRDWAQKASREGLTDIALLIETAAGKTTRINREFEKAVALVKMKSHI
jgi:hypothetical protein